MEFRICLGRLRLRKLCLSVSLLVNIVMYCIVAFNDLLLFFKTKRSLQTSLLFLDQIAEENLVCGEEVIVLLLVSSVRFQSYVWLGF